MHRLMIAERANGKHPGGRLSVRPVRYRVRGSTLASGICHCRSCRKTASAPTLPFATFPTAAFEITQAP